MKNIVYLLLAVLTACSRHDGAVSGGDAGPTLPPSWYLLPEQGGTDSPPEPINESTGRALGNLFGLYPDALEKSVPEFTATGFPNDVVPWHLDGAIVNFAVATGGLFGTTTVDGAAAVRATWRRPLPANAALAPVRQPEGIAFTGSMTSADVSRILEPAVQTALSTKRILNEAAFRANLTDQGVRFLNICRTLERLPPMPGWKPAAFALNLGFGASGKLSAVMGVGAAIGMTFVWVAPGIPPPQPPPRPGDIGGETSLRTFAINFESLLPAATAQASRMGYTGLTLDIIEVGIAIGAQGNIGVASATGAVAGKLAFIRNTNPMLPAASLEEKPSFTLPVVSAPLTASQRSALGGLTEVSDGASSIVVIPAARMLQGIQNAIAMGSTFAQRARANETPTWRLTSIETEFAVTVTGNFKVVTASAAPSLTLRWDRKKQ